MIWYILGSVILIILLLLKFKNSGGQPLLSASIATNDGFDFEIKIQQLHPDVKSIEYLRLILNFITRVYYVSGESKEDNRAQIRYFLQIMSESNSLQNGLLNFNNQVKIVEIIPLNEKSKKIVATLLYKNIQTRNIFTKLPSRWYPNQFYFSILALTFYCVAFLEEYQQELLLKSFKNLAKEYYSSKDTKSLKASNILPNKAFIEATFPK